MEKINFKISVLLIWVLNTLILLALIKMINIFLLTMRGVGLQWPFNSYLFDVDHRFTDWLIAWRWSEEINPWDTHGDLITKIPPTPYGPITFWYMKATSFMKPILSFFSLVLVYVVMLFYIIKKSVDLKSNSSVIFLTLIVLFCSYPLHFLIDRGNADVLGVVLIQSLILVFLNFNESVKRNFIVDLIVIFIIGSKPSWGALIIISFYTMSFKRISRVTMGVVLIYMIPGLFDSFKYMDYIDSVKLALNILDQVTHFSNHLLVIYYSLVRAGVIQSFDIKFSILLAGVFLYVCYFVYLSTQLKYISPANRSALDILNVLILLAFTYMFNSPSPDYRLTALIAYVFLIPYLYENYEFNFINNLLICKIIVFSIAVIISWSVYYTKGGFSISSVMRSLLILIVFITALISLNSLKSSGGFKDEVQRLNN